MIDIATTATSEIKTEDSGHDHGMHRWSTMIGTYWFRKCHMVLVASHTCMKLFDPVQTNEYSNWFRMIDEQKDPVFGAFGLHFPGQRGSFFRGQDLPRVAQSFEVRPLVGEVVSERFVEDD